MSTEMQGSLGLGVRDMRSKLHIRSLSVRNGTGVVSGAGHFLTGTGTRFSTEIRAGDLVGPSGCDLEDMREVVQVSSDEALVLALPFDVTVAMLPFQYLNPSLVVDTAGHEQ